MSHHPRPLHPEEIQRLSRAIDAIEIMWGNRYEVDLPHTEGSHHWVAVDLGHLAVAHSELVSLQRLAVPERHGTIKAANVTPEVVGELWGIWRDGGLVTVREDTAANVGEYFEFRAVNPDGSDRGASALFKVYYIFGGLTSLKPAHPPSEYLLDRSPVDWTHLKPEDVRVEQ